MYPDALSMAAAAISGWYTETGHLPGWHNFTIYRLLTGGGWLVSATQTAIVLDKWAKVAA